MYQSVHDAFVCLETRGGHVCNRGEENVEQERCEHASLTKALFHSKLPRAHPVVEPHAYSHAIVELTNDRDHILWHAKTAEYCPEEGSINGVVRFGKVDKAYTEWNSFLPRQLLQPTNHKHHIGGRTVQSETTLFPWQDPHALTVLAEVASDDLQQFPAGVRYQRDASVVAALCPILLFMEYRDDGIFPLLRHLPPPPNTNDHIEQSPVQGGITFEAHLEQLNGDSVWSERGFVFVLLIERDMNIRYIFFAVSDGLPAVIYEHDYLKALHFLRYVLHTRFFFLPSANWNNSHVRAKGNHHEIFRRMRGDQ